MLLLVELASAYSYIYQAKKHKTVDTASGIVPFKNSYYNIVNNAYTLWGTTKQWSNTPPFVFSCSLSPSQHRTILIPFLISCHISYWFLYSASPSSTAQSYTLRCMQGSKLNDNISPPGFQVLLTSNAHIHQSSLLSCDLIFITWHEGWKSVDLSYSTLWTYKTRSLQTYVQTAFRSILSIFSGVDLCGLTDCFQGVFYRSLRT